VSRHRPPPMDILSWKASISRHLDRPPCASRARVNTSFMRSPHVWSFFQCIVTGQKHACACICQKKHDASSANRARSGRVARRPDQAPSGRRDRLRSWARSSAGHGRIGVEQRPPGIRDCRSTEAHHRGETGGHGGTDPGHPHRDEGTAQPEDAGDQEVLDP
jgi:hypothetical protein